MALYDRTNASDRGTLPRKTAVLGACATPCDGIWSCLAHTVLAARDCEPGAPLLPTAFAFTLPQSRKRAADGSAARPSLTASGVAIPLPASSAALAALRGSTGSGSRAIDGAEVGLSPELQLAVDNLAMHVAHFRYGVDECSSAVQPMLRALHVCSEATFSTRREHPAVCAGVLLALPDTPGGVSGTFRAGCAPDGAPRELRAGPLGGDAYCCAFPVGSECTVDAVQYRSEVRGACGLVLEIDVVRVGPGTDACAPVSAAAVEALRRARLRRIGRQWGDARWAHTTTPFGGLLTCTSVPERLFVLLGEEETDVVARGASRAWDLPSGSAGRRVADTLLESAPLALAVRAGLLTTYIDEDEDGGGAVEGGRAGSETHRRDRVRMVLRCGDVEESVGVLPATDFLPHCGGLDIPLQLVPEYAAPDVVAARDAGGARRTSKHVRAVLEIRPMMIRQRFGDNLAPLDSCIECLTAAVGFADGFKARGVWVAQDDEELRGVLQHVAGQALRERKHLRSVLALACQLNDVDVARGVLMAADLRMDSDGGQDAGGGASLSSADLEKALEAFGWRQISFFAKRAFQRTFNTSLVWNLIDNKLMEHPDGDAGDRRDPGGDAACVQFATDALRRGVRGATDAAMAVLYCLPNSPTWSLFSHVRDLGAAVGWSTAGPAVAKWLRRVLCAARFDIFGDDDVATTTAASAELVKLATDAGCLDDVAGAVDAGRFDAFAVDAMLEGQDMASTRVEDGTFRMRLVAALESQLRGGRRGGAAAEELQRDADLPREKDQGQCGECGRHTEDEERDPDDTGSARVGEIIRAAFTQAVRAAPGAAGADFACGFTFSTSPEAAWQAADGTETTASLRVSKIGDVALPIDSASLDALSEVAELARYTAFELGPDLEPRAERQWVDEIDAGCVEVAPDLETRIELFAKHLSRDRFGVSGGVRPVLRQMCLHAKGDRFVFHRDTPLPDSVFGTMVVQLPTQEGHLGGEINVRRDPLDPSSPSDPSETTLFADREELGPYFCDGGHDAYCFAFTGESAVDSAPLVDGRRAALVYDLERVDADGRGVSRPDVDVVERQRAWFANVVELWRDAAFLERPTAACGAPIRLILPLEELYSDSDLAAMGFAALGGDDAAVARAFCAGADDTHRPRHDVPFASYAGDDLLEVSVGLIETRFWGEPAPCSGANSAFGRPRSCSDEKAKKVPFKTSTVGVLREETWRSITTGAQLWTLERSEEVPAVETLPARAGGDGTLGSAPVEASYDDQLTDCDDPNDVQGELCKTFRRSAIQFRLRARTEADVRRMSIVRAMADVRYAEKDLDATGRGDQRDAAKAVLRGVTAYFPRYASEFMREALELSVRLRELEAARSILAHVDLRKCGGEPCTGQIVFSDVVRAIEEFGFDELAGTIQAMFESCTRKPLVVPRWIPYKHYEPYSTHAGLACLELASQVRERRLRGAKQLALKAIEALPLAPTQRVIDAVRNLAGSVGWKEVAPAVIQWIENVVVARTDASETAQAEASRTDRSEAVSPAAAAQARSKTVAAVLALAANVEFDAIAKMAGRVRGSLDIAGALAILEALSSRKVPFREVLRVRPLLVETLLDLLAAPAGAGGAEPRIWTAEIGEAEAARLAEQRAAVAAVVRYDESARGEQRVAQVIATPAHVGLLHALTNDPRPETKRRFAKVLLRVLKENPPTAAGAPGGWSVCDALPKHPDIPAAFLRSDCEKCQVEVHWCPTTGRWGACSQQMRDAQETCRPLSVEAGKSSSYRRWALVVTKTPEWLAAERARFEREEVARLNAILGRDTQPRGDKKKAVVIVIDD